MLINCTIFHGLMAVAQIVYSNEKGFFKEIDFLEMSTFVLLFTFVLH